MRTLLLALALLLAAAPAYAQKTKGLFADTSGVYELRDVTTPPRALNVADLREALVNTYPAPLRDAAVNGIVQAIAKLRFSPARLEGRPVAVWVVQPIHWTVEM